MKKITVRRRMLSLTLAASVALPQASSAFAASLWDENGIDRRVAQAIESGQPDPQETAMPWVTLPTDDKLNQPETTPEVTEGTEEIPSTPGSEEQTTPATVPPQSDGLESQASPPPAASSENAAPSPAPSVTTTPDHKDDAFEGGEVPPDAGIPNVETTPAAPTESAPVQPSPGEETPPPEEVSTPDPSTSEPAGGEGLDETEKPADTALSTTTNSASLAMPVSAGTGPLTRWMYYRLGYGVQVNSSVNKALIGLNELFAVESTEGGKEIIVEDDSGYPIAMDPVEYGYRDYRQYLTNDISGGSDGVSLCIFPTAEQLGRVPDQQFAGWYVYPSGVKADQSGRDAMNWVYGDLVEASVSGKMEYVDTYPYEPGDAYYSASYLNESDRRYQNSVNLTGAYPTFGSLGDSWDGGRDYGYGYMYGDKDGIEEVWDEWTGTWVPLLGDGATNPVSFVGRWEASDESRASEVALTAMIDGEKTALDLYDEGYDNAGKFQSDRHEYWLRVPADVDSLSLDLSTLELYYADYDTEDLSDYDGYALNRERSHVQVTAGFGSETTNYINDLSAKMLPQWSGIAQPNNSLENPAHSVWSVAEIDLRNASGGILYNDIVVEVTSPSGKQSTTYTFHVQRLAEPTLTQAWGNTPVGMIRRDTHNLSTTDAASQAEAKFKESYRFDSNQGMYPNGGENQNGTIFRKTYSPNAWLRSAQNVDIDPTAIVVYQDSSFLDPGISLVGTMGESVNIAQGNVSRALSLKHVDTLLPTQIGKNAGEDCWYTASGLVTSEEAVFEPLSAQDGSDVIDLRGLNILPGIYTLEYRYRDPISGKVYGSDEADYVTEAGKEAAAAFRRTVVVLPAPGDVDMDGAVTMADALALKRMLGYNTTLGYTTLNGEYLANRSGEVVTQDSSLALFAYRVCDVNYDGILDDKDVQLLSTLPNPKLTNVSNPSNSDYYYIPLPAGQTSGYTRQPFAVESADTPKIEMVYLGKEGGKPWSSDSGYMTGITGPWASDVDTGVELDDIFWLGVKLDKEGMDSLTLEAVKMFTFTLIYDTRYLEPAVVLEQQFWEGAGTGNETAAELSQKRWETMMSLYNLANGASGHTVWGDSPYAYGFTKAAGLGPRFTANAAHYSTAVLPLESTLGETATDHDRLKSITFSVELNSGSNAVLVQNSQGEYLLAVPFKMIRHPFGQTTARLAEFEAGMRGFTLVGINDTTYAYSSQENVFGGHTQNLNDLLPYGNVGAEIPLGEDKTEVYYIYNFNHDGKENDSGSTTNAVYDEGFYSRGGRTAEGVYQDFTLGGALQGDLPRGLTYNIDSASIDGTPEEAGTFEFYIGSTPYRLVVDKAPLHFWADNQSSYYGQSEFRGSAYAGFTFKYDVNDIRSIEKARADASGGEIRVDGYGSGLEALLADPVYAKKENQPTFTAVTQPGGSTAVTSSTPVGTYSIVNPLTPVSSNYEFIYSPEMATGTVGLTILRRPVQVVRMNGTEDDPAVIGSVFSDEVGTLGQRKAQRGTAADPGAVTFTVRLGTTATDAPGYYSGLPLTTNQNYVDGAILPGDKLEITYSADYIRHENELSGNFILAGAQSEYRDVEVRDIRLTGGINNENYVLVSSAADTAVVPNCVVGEVILRRVLSLRMTQLPPMEYQYGDSFTRANELHYFIMKDGDEKEGEYRFNSDDMAGMGISVYWASAEEKAAYENGEEFDSVDSSDPKWKVVSGQRFTTEFNGRYLCMSTMTVNDAGENIMIRQYSEIPLTVHARDIVLTATSTHRYYGEENGTLTFTYDPRQLAAIDYRGDLTGAGEELLEILSDDNYRQPVLEVVMNPMAPDAVTPADRLDASSEYTGRDNSVIIYGAQSDNYHFLYRYTNAEGVTVTQENYGASVYRIDQRPIVVEAITRTDPLVEIYADTHRIYTDNKTLGMNEVELTLPNHTAATTSYYLPGASSSVPTTTDISFVDGATAVVTGDEISFTYTATVVPTDGIEYARYVDFSHGYFNMDDVGPEGYKVYPVQITNLRLTGKKANNYTLVYKSSDKSKLETTNQTITVRENTFQPEIPAGYTYYAAGVSAEGDTYREAQGLVWLRPIAKIEVTSSGRTNYTYGETYDPSQSNRDNKDSKPMVIHIEYVNDEKNNFDGNPYIGEVQFRVAGTHDDEVYTTFDTRSLKIYYVKDGESVADVVGDAGRVLDLRSALSVIEHNGTRLVVTGQRGGQENLIISEPTSATLRVNPKMLTLRAVDQRRVYGEENPVFGFTFSSGELAQQDRVKLRVDEFTVLSGERLKDLGLDYKAPTYTTTATAGSDVRNGGQAGYEIAVKPEDAGSLENYTLQCEPGTLYIYPRPVKISSFTSSEEAPIYTIFSDVAARVFWNNVDQTRFALALTESGYHLEDGTYLRTTGPALFENDEMTLRIQVQYPQNLDLSSDAAKGAIAVQVTDASIVAGTRAAGNYVLETHNSLGNEVAVIANGSAVGTVELRNITTIAVTHWPNKMSYTYGEALDLSGLQVTIYYNTEGGSGTGQTTVVDYMGTDQFAQHGLYVNYYDDAALDPDDTWESIKDDYRSAASGDHLTIAPTHDSQLAGKREWFAANGKYLIVSAQRHSDQQASRPIISSSAIVVTPLPITFALSAEDKIYNGNIQAAGTITFTNIFNQSGYVDSLNTAGVTDLVYPVTGASYEEQWGGGYTRRENFSYFNEYVARNGYSFTTGSYVANDPSILTENKTLSWTPGYVYGEDGTLTFAYLDPNVAYAQTPEHDYYGALTTKGVQVTGLRLAGPDAANYTLVGRPAGTTVEVTTNNVTAAQGYLGSGLPQATIHKANRTALTTELLPEVEIDVHTNVVRVNYDQSLSAITGGEENGHQDELHFEFALQKIVTGEESAPAQPAPTDPEGGAEGLSEDGPTVAGIVQWAGSDGKSAWGDARYFGGESAPKTDMPITSEDPEAGPYVPREEDLPKGDSISETTAIKGQVYQWSALDDGFVLDPTAYPGGVIWPGYELYTTDRTALDRDQVYLAVVRAAETHNYNASPALSSVEGYTAAMIQAILEAQSSLDSATTGAAHEAAQQALNEAVAAADGPLKLALQTAHQDAQAEVDALMSAGESGSKLEERPTRTASPAVKTYKQVIETVSVKEMQGAESDTRTEPYRVPTLEAIWFTDVEELSSKEVLDAVVWNVDPVRYRRYAWDRDFTAELAFEKDEEPISLRAPFEVSISTKGENGSGDSEELIRVNEDHNARIYADITFPSGSGGIKPELIVIRPGSIMAVLGDEAVALEVTFYPKWATVSNVVWSSSDPDVAVVDGQGRVTFVGVGTAVITATIPGSYTGASPVCSASIAVTVVEDWRQEYPNSIFDFGNLDAFLVSGDSGAEGDKYFLPENGITRGETAKLLAQFYVENPTWSKHGPDDFPDLTGEEDYAEAAQLLGSLGVFVGYPEGGFNGEQYISRAEFVTLLVRMTGLDIVDTAGQPHAFLDTGEDSTWAYAEIDALSTQTSGVLLGVGEGYFDPDRNITRSEVAALLTRLLRFPMNQNGEVVVPVDVEEDYWARECILRAVNGSGILEESMLLEEQ